MIPCCHCVWENFGSELTWKRLGSAQRCPRAARISLPMIEWFFVVLGEKGLGFLHHTRFC